MNNINISPISEVETDKRRICEIRFDCIVIMHDSGTREVSTKSLPPQWFKMNSQITLEEIKYGDEIALGTRLKQMYYELAKTIEQYEQFR
jgi:hypothetical protein